MCTVSQAWIDDTQRQARFSVERCRFSLRGHMWEHLGGADG